MSIERTRISYVAIPPLPAHITRAAAVMVRHRARDEADAALLLGALGLDGREKEPRHHPMPTPSRRSCRACGRYMRPVGAKAAEYPGSVLHVGRGRCVTCWRHWKALQAAAADAARAELDTLPPEPDELTRARLYELDLATAPRRTA